MGATIMHGTRKGGKGTKVNHGCDKCTINHIGLTWEVISDVDLSAPHFDGGMERGGGCSRDKKQFVFALSRC